MSKPLMFACMLAVALVATAQRWLPSTTSYVEEQPKIHRVSGGFGR